MTLDRDDVEAIAIRVAELLRPTVGIGLVGVDEVVARFGISRSYVYEHADELGAIRLGDGPKARLRFDVERVDEALGRSRRTRPTAPSPQPAMVGLPAGVKLIRGRKT
jgi:hypothetical protein